MVSGTQGEEVETVVCVGVYQGLGALFPVTVYTSSLPIRQGLPTHHKGPTSPRDPSTEGSDVKRTVLISGRNLGTEGPPPGSG